jgi:hypothetical protein
MTIDAPIDLTDRECAELLKALSGPGTQTQKWYAVVRKAFAQGVERGSESQALSEKLVEPLIDIAETVARAGGAPAEKVTERYGLYRLWAQEFQSDFAQRDAAGERPAATYQTDIERFALAKALDWGIVPAARPATASASLAPPDVHRDFAIRYIEPEMLTGFIESLLNDAGVRDFELDQAVFDASKHEVHAFATELEKRIASKPFAEVNAAGRSAQVEYLAARVGVQGAYEFALQCKDERDRDESGDRHSAGG